MERNDYADALAARDPRDPCPTCAMVGGYCGGENHPSCGLFADGRPVAAAATRFYWTWDGADMAPDPTMTRARAAAMLRAWRADPDIRITLAGRRTYRGETEGAGRVGWTMEIR